MMNEKLKKDDHKIDKKIKELEQAVATNLAGWQKALADYQNLQRENEQKIIGLKGLIISDLVHELLPIFDNYQTAIDHIPENQKKESWAVGLKHILKMWESFLSNHNIEQIKAIGEIFDPHWHEAVSYIEDKTKDEQEIVVEKQAGFTLNGQVIRPAKVIINQFPPKVDQPLAGSQ